MAVDRTLIQGAYRAAVDPRIGVTTRGLMNIGSSIKQVTDAFAYEQRVKSERANQAFTDNIMNAKLDPASSNSLIDATMQQRQAYIDTKDPIERQKILNNVNSMSQDFGELEFIIEELSSGNTKISNTFSNTQEGLNFSEAISDPSNIQVVDGKPGLIINDQFMDKDDLEKYVNSKTMDTSFTKVMNALALDQQQDKKDLGDEYYFDKEYVMSKVKADIDRSANYRSLYEDNLYGNRNFKADLIESLGNYTYSNLGITEEMLADSQVNNTDGIDVDEIQNILSYLEGNEYALREVLAGYYTDLLQQQFDPYRKTQSAESERFKPQTSNQTTATSNDVSGGNIGDDGVYIPEQVDNQQEQTSGNYNYTGISSLSVDASGGSANILEDGNKITMKNVKTGNMLVPEVNVEGVKAEGTNIVIATNLVDQNFGKFVKRGSGYKWVADEKNMKLFNENATAKQKKAFNEFIQIVQTDPAYAEQLLKHIKSGSGNINAGTLK